MNDELKNAVIELRSKFAELLKLAPANLPSMEPYRNLTLATAKVSKLKAHTEWESPIENFARVVDSFTPDFYNAMNSELRALIPESRHNQANRLFDDIKAQVSSIQRQLHASNPNPEQHQPTEEESKIAEMMAAFKR